MLSWTLTIAFAALLIERLVGYPRWLQWMLGHPVIWMGTILSGLDTRLNRRPESKFTGRIGGTIALGALLVLALVIAIPVALLCRSLPYGWIYEALLAVPLIAQFELRECVRAVGLGLDRNLDEGRDAVRHIVGRDTTVLDESGVARAALESLAENTSDGIVAPVLWLAIFGLPGIAVYKAINTADSMIGHKNARYLHFGWAAARMDDIVNLPCARLTGFLIAAAASLTSPTRGSAAIECMIRDANKHFSPNAGWPEAALAGALDVRLGGPRWYEGRKLDLAWIGGGQEVLTSKHIREGLALQGRTLTIFTGLIGLLSVFTP